MPLFMKEVIDLYTKTVLASISFVGLSCTLLIPLYYPMMEKARKHHQEILDILRVNLSAILMNGQHFSEKMNDAIIQMNKLVEDNKRILRLLNAKRMISRILLALFGAVIFMGAVNIPYVAFYNLDADALKYGSICLSVICFGYCLMICRQLFLTLLRIQTEDDFGHLEDTDQAYDYE
jgi:hypothetical protein